VTYAPDGHQDISLPLTPEAPRSARRWLRGYGRVPAAVRERALLLVSELVANSVKHSGLSSTEHVDVHVMPVPTGLRVEVVDDGIGMGSAPRRRSDSFGLRLVESLADRWGHQDHPTRVWFEIIIGREALHAPS
jgi:anti-sigma regulatory factor (Ser/Thr protein kinase)